MGWVSKGLFGARGDREVHKGDYPPMNNTHIIYAY